MWRVHRPVGQHDLCNASELAGICMLGSFRRAIVLGVLGIATAACGSGAAPGAADRDHETALQELQSAIEASTGYTPSHLEILASPAHVLVLLSDDELARADVAAHEKAALVVASAVERSIVSNARLAAIEEISVAIIHPERAQGLLWNEHTEEVFYFKKSPDQHFVPDTT
jgi:hypothetical protein